MSTALGQPRGERVALTKVSLNDFQLIVVRDGHGSSVQHNTGTQGIFGVSAVADELILDGQALGERGLGHGDGDLRVGFHIDVRWVRSWQVEDREPGAVGQGTSINDRADVPPCESVETGGNGGDRAPKRMRNDPTRAFHLLGVIWDVDLSKVQDVTVFVFVFIIFYFFGVVFVMAMPESGKWMELGCCCLKVFRIDDAAASKRSYHPNVFQSEFVNDEVMSFRPARHGGVLVEQGVPTGAAVRIVVVLAGRACLQGSGERDLGATWIFGIQSSVLSACGLRKVLGGRQGCLADRQRHVAVVVIVAHEVEKEETFARHTVRQDGGFRSAFICIRACLQCRRKVADEAGSPPRAFADKPPCFFCVGLLGIDLDLAGLDFACFGGIATRSGDVAG
mmetsp:Transcript_7633/g.22220  ORF Transcript_7633/g.22220 Transcript_7633/m.22220 type:complete len:393 (-) Transcript_7633:69-1247(-)